MTAIQSSAAPQPERRTDPSMEEILASIRRIIADEDAAPQPSAAPDKSPRDPVDLRPAAVVTSFSPQLSAPQAAAPRPPGQPPFGLSRPQPAARDPSPSVQPYRSEASAPPVDAVDASEAPALQAEPLPVPPTPEVPHFETLADGSGPSDGGALVSAAASDSIASAFQTLATSVALTSSDVIDRHVRDLLRPMLRTWLDDNLPVIVEKLVRIEIERVARGGR